MGWRGRDRGGGAIEMAIMLPVVLGCVFLTAHLCLLYLANQAAMSIAQVAVEGERGWQAEPGAGTERAERFREQLPTLLTDVTIDVQVVSDGQQVTATVTGDAISIVPWFTHTVSQTVSGPVERVTEAP